MKYLFKMFVFSWCITLFVTDAIASVSKVCRGNIVAIRHGYTPICLSCHGQITISKDKIQFLSKSKLITLKISNVIWQQLERLAKNTHLKCGEEVVDGTYVDDRGEEWIEIEMENGKRKKVIFRNGEYPKSVGIELGSQLKAIDDWVGLGVGLGAL